MKDRHTHGFLVVQEGAQAVIAGTEFDASDILEFCFFAEGTIFDNDFGKVFFGDESALGIDRELVRNFFGERLLADRTSGDLHVLLADRVDDIAGCHAARGGFIGIDPNAHGIISATKKLDLSDAGQTCELILDVEDRVVAEVERIVAIRG